jgi:hypothetical protein
VPPCGACADARRAAQAFDAAEQDQRAELADALDGARADPAMRCEHGTDGGRYVRADTGQSHCALCRAQQRNPA